MAAFPAGDGAGEGRRYAPLLAVLALFACLSLIYTRSVPPFEGPDEPQHYAYVIWLAEGRGLPPQGEEGWETPIQQEAGQAPLYYFLASLPVRLAQFDNPPAEFRPNPHFPSGAPGYIPDNKNLAVHYPDDNDLRGGWLALQLARGVSFLFGILLIVSVYKLGQAFFPESRFVPAVSALFTAVVPQVLFISNVVSNDIAAAATGAFALWLLVLLLRRGPSMKMAFTFGLAFGLAALSKSSNLALAFPAAGGFLWLWLRETEQRGKVLRAATAAAGAAVLAAGWWYVRNWLLYNSPFGLTAHYLAPWALSEDVLRSNPTAQWLEVFYSLWAAFGWGNIKFPGWVYYALMGLSLLAAAGLAIKARKLWRGWRQIPLWLLVPVPAVGAMVIVLELWMRQVTAPHGRLLFPVLGAMAVLFVAGWEEIHRRLVYAAAGYLLILACLSPILLIRPAYELPEFLAGDGVQSSESPELNWQFGDFARLVSVRPLEQSAAAGEALPVSVCWQTLGPAAEDYSFVLQLIGPENQIVGGRRTYPGLGSYPTSIWEPGKAFCDLIRVDIPADLARSLQYQIEAGLVAASGERVPATNADGAPRDHLFAATVRLETAETPELAQIPEGDDPIRLVRADFSRQWQAGTVETVALQWWAAEAVDRDYTVFVHLREMERGENVAQGDGPPVNGWYPTSLWETGEVVEDEHAVAVTAEVAPGAYHLVVGWYDPATGERLGGETPLGTVEVVP
jgi:hypothetical protein